MVIIIIIIIIMCDICFLLLVFNPSDLYYLGYKKIVNTEERKPARRGMSLAYT